MVDKNSHEAPVCFQSSMLWHNGKCLRQRVNTDIHCWTTDWGSYDDTTGRSQTQLSLISLADSVWSQWVMLTLLLQAWGYQNWVPCVLEIFFHYRVLKVTFVWNTKLESQIKIKNSECKKKHMTKITTKIIGCIRCTEYFLMRLFCMWHLYHLITTALAGTPSGRITPICDKQQAQTKWSREGEAVLWRDLSVHKCLYCTHFIDYGFKYRLNAWLLLTTLTTADLYKGKIVGRRSLPICTFPSVRGPPPR